MVNFEFAYVISIVFFYVHMLNKFKTLLTKGKIHKVNNIGVQPSSS